MAGKSDFAIELPHGILTNWRDWFCHTAMGVCPMALSLNQRLGMNTLSVDTIAVDRPVRWDHPLDPEMLTRDIQWMLEQRPFSTMNRDLFPSYCSLEDILRHDCRVQRFEPGDIVVREGDYGSSAFLVLRGSVRAFLEHLWQDRGKPDTNQLPLTFLKWLKQSFQSLRPNKQSDNKVSLESHTEHRNSSRRSRSKLESQQDRLEPVQKVESSEHGNRIFLQDIEAVIDGYQSEPLGVGEIFGEMAAITRTQHRFTVIANAPTVVLEIRWQGLRVLRRDKTFRNYLDTRFRETSLKTHLRETALFRFLDDESMNTVMAATQIESVGEREWFSEYRDIQKLDVQQQIEREPIIATEGRSVDHLILVRAGFARMSFERGRGHQTVAYLGRGQMHGLSELTHQFRNPGDKPLPFQESLRALGFVDILRIPSQLVLKTILPCVRSSELPKPIDSPRYDEGGLIVSESIQPLTKPVRARPSTSASVNNSLETSLIEFLVDERLINGRQTMLIDLDRCTGCDECVKACASTHDGTPRFVRNGKQHGPLLFAHACMHCTDPVCMIGCPTGAIARDQDTGVISINPNTCIGCKTCSESCPYDNIVMIQVRDKQGRASVDRVTQLPILQASKCDMCHVLGSGPACQNACPHEALVRIDTSDPAPLDTWLAKRAA
jgi:Fe-S-cluster-containing dehydrogenase component/CRP-like cAMP-binding protein